MESIGSTEDHDMAGVNWIMGDTHADKLTKLMSTGAGYALPAARHAYGIGSNNPRAKPRFEIILHTSGTVHQLLVHSRCHWRQFREGGRRLYKCGHSTRKSMATHLHCEGVSIR